MIKRILLMAGTTLLLAGCIGYSRSQVELERFNMAKQAEAVQLAKDIIAVRDAECADDEPRWWALFEQSFVDAETKLRAAGIYTPDNSAKLRRRYLAAADELRVKIARKKDQYNTLARVATSQADGWDVHSQVTAHKADLDHKFTQQIQASFTDLVEEMVAASAAKAAAGNVGGSTPPAATDPDTGTGDATTPTDTNLGLDN